ncbi:winged helix-turn-helix transcriptional regulator [Streptomyces sp. NPDC088354]|uniref:winged helix-turn-helix transcriptional regulator n=1 Tax=unclassified Streptomyces TaxID=2593676 RepID=UPI0029A21181|nr:helix-turn-helix domain-containing protein [Streptomyces sp. MI02-7b]MDX3071095.1 helix-turn-helix domain-containing protein [Streptomyces sp. MI02-7b]
MSRSYEQICHIARALDVLGERWTLLIVRELTLGPRRYSDLLDALPGMGTSLLAARLKHLGAYDVVRRTTLRGPGHAAAYELGARGEALLPLLASLASWGGGLGPPPAGYADRAAWSLVAMRLTAPGRAAGFTTLTELVVGDETLWLQGDGEQVRAEIGPAPMRPGMRLICEKATLYALARGRVAVDDAIASGDLVVEGDADTARLFFELFSLTDGDHATSS